MAYRQAQLHAEYYCEDRNGNRKKTCKSRRISQGAKNIFRQQDFMLFLSRKGDAGNEEKGLMACF